VTKDKQGVPIMTRLTFAIRTVAFSMLVAQVFVPSAAAQSRVYVDASATGANDGTSWEDAFEELWAAVDASTDGTEIWVADGVLCRILRRGHERMPCAV